MEILVESVFAPQNTNHYVSLGAYCSILNNIFNIFQSLFCTRGNHCNNCTNLLILPLSAHLRSKDWHCRADECLVDGLWVSEKDSWLRLPLDYNGKFIYSPIRQQWTSQKLSRRRRLSIFTQILKLEWNLNQTKTPFRCLFCFRDS